MGPQERNESIISWVIFNGNIILYLYVAFIFINKKYYCLFYYYLFFEVRYIKTRQTLHISTLSNFKWKFYFILRAFDVSFISIFNRLTLLEIPLTWNLRSSTTKGQQIKSKGDANTNRDRLSLLDPETNLSFGLDSEAWLEEWFLLLWRWCHLLATLGSFPSIGLQFISGRLNFCHPFRPLLLNI